MIITDTIKNYALGGMAAVLVVSMLGNAWLYSELDDAQAAAVKATEEMKNAQGAAKACNDGVNDLLAKAQADWEAARPKIEASKASESQHGTRAQEILKTAPTPGLSGCVNAANMGRKWLKERRK